MTKRAVIYARTSRDDRKTDLPSNEDQLQEGRRLAAKYGYHVVEEIREDDGGASGYDPDLLGMRRVLALADDRAFDVLIALRLDRLARLQWRTVQIAWELLEQKHIAIHLAADDQLMDDYEESLLIFMLHGWNSEKEGRDIAKKLARKRRVLVDQGQVMVHGAPPYGYDLVRDKKAGVRELAINEEQAAAIRLIYDLYTGADKRGPMGTNKVAAVMSESGYPTYADIRPSRNLGKQSGRGVWNHGTIYRILKNETYAGVWHYGKNGEKRLPGNCKVRFEHKQENRQAVEVPAIIGREAWEAAQKQMEKNRHRRHRKGGAFLPAKRAREMR